MDAAALVQEAREGASLTVRELAVRAEVAASTVSRIERRQMDPTVGMLTRLIAAAGLELELRSLHTYRGNFGALADALEVDPDGTTHPDWRRRGLYRATLAHRAALAIERGASLVRVDTSPESRPILLALGLYAVATTVPCVLEPTPDAGSSRSA